MQELERQAYLEALGVAIWLPGRELPGAGESRPLDYFQAAPEPAGEQEEIPRQASSQPAPPSAPGQQRARPATQSGRGTSDTVAAASTDTGNTAKKSDVAREALEQLKSRQGVAGKAASGKNPQPASPSKPEAPSADGVSQASGQEQASEVDRPEFTYMLYRLPEERVLLVEFAVPQAPGLSSSELVLLENILASQSYERFQWDNGKAPCFRWPAVRVQGNVAAGWAEAKEGLQVFLRKNLGDASLLSLGGKWLGCFGATGDFSSPQLLELEEAGISARITWSLSDMLEDGTRKRHCWEQIKRW